MNYEGILMKNVMEERESVVFIRPHAQFPVVLELGMGGGAGRPWFFLTERWTSWTTTQIKPNNSQTIPSTEDASTIMGM